MNQPLTSADLFWEGVNLMFVGMGFVLLFLLLLIVALSGISRLINRYFPDPVPAAESAKNPPIFTASTDETPDLDRLRPVIVAAIAHHRRRQGLN